MTIKELITSFDNMIQSAAKIHNFIKEEQEDTGRQYIGASVVETMPNGSKREAIITEIEWCPTCGLKDGNWLIYVSYTDEEFLVPGAWVTREVLTLAGSE